MKNKLLVSVIIPIYNAEECLKACLDSVVGQTWKMLEIILIDDGSTDRSAQMCDAYAEKDKRICVIHQKNAGAAAARKNGVQHASGSYICFVDADDWIQEEMIHFFIENIGECDLLTSGRHWENSSGEFLVRMDSFDEGIYDTEEKRRYFLENMIIFENRFEDGVLPFLWNKMYRADILKEVINDIDTTIVYAEDRDLLFRYILKTEKIRVVHQSFYYYRYNKKSITRTPNRNFMGDLNGLYLSLSKVFESHPLKESLMRQLQLFVISRIYQIPGFMGFCPDAQILGYVFPFSNLKCGSKVVLYGAGRVGVSYYRHIYRQGALEMVLWVDKAFTEYQEHFYPVVSPDRLSGCEYDYIIIAVKQEKTADEIRTELMEKGIADEKILWRVPAVL